MADQIDRLLKKNKVRASLHVSRATLDRYIARGDLPIVRLSERAIRISESALRAFVQERTERRRGKV